MLNYRRYLNTKEGQTWLKTITKEAEAHTLYPPRHAWFRAFELAPLDDLKIIILGQDPYHQPHQAHGLAFSVPKSQPLPPSLKNIFKALSDDLGCAMPSHGDLSSWATQGVLLLNTRLTVDHGEPLHARHAGWAPFIHDVMRQLADYPKPLVFCLWGNHAQSYASYFEASNHLILKTSHPSPLSAHRGFKTAQHFSKANAFLVSKGRTPIEFCLKDETLF